MTSEEADKVSDQVAHRAMEDLKSNIQDFLTMDADQVPWGVVSTLAEAAAEVQDYLVSKLEE